MIKDFALKTNEMKDNYVFKVGEVYSNPKKIGGNGRGAVYLTKGLSPTIVTMSGGGNHPYVVIEYGIY